MHIASGQTKRELYMTDNTYFEGYNSAIIVGDVDNAAICGLSYSLVHFFIASDLRGLQKFMDIFFQQMVSLVVAL